MHWAEFTSLSQYDDFASSSSSAEVVEFQVSPGQVGRHGAGVAQRVPRSLSEVDFSGLLDNTKLIN